jgi:hypothetical protein
MPAATSPVYVVSSTVTKKDASSVPRLHVEWVLLVINTVVTYALSVTRVPVILMTVGLIQLQ